MGSTASKQAKSARTFSKVITETGTLKRSNVDNLSQLHNNPIKPPNNNIENVSTIKLPHNNNNDTSHILKNANRSNPDYSKKDGMDPDYNAKALALGTVTIEETKLNLNRNNMAIKTLQNRETLINIGEEQKLKLENKVLLDPRTLTEVLKDLTKRNIPKEQVEKTYHLHEDYLKNLHVGIINLPKEKIKNSQKTMDDVEFNNKKKFKKEPNELQKQLDNLLS